MPGEISMAHNGVLFLDELPEFTRKTLEALRQPLEEGQVHLSRAHYSVTYPSAVMLVCSMNPSAEGSGEVSASYLKKISGPLLDRIDLHLEVPAVTFEKLSKTSPSECSAIIGQRVLATRLRQIKRFNAKALVCNTHMRSKEIDIFCSLKKPVLDLLEQAMNQLGLSARAYHRIIKVARTIADMDQSQYIRAEHMAEAVQYRVLDRQD
jgi:magnesium chelatase family protein